MGNIVLLDELTINKIAAGEVVERPASVIKELVENAIDAGATKITVEIKRGGITYIRVTDNGCGIAYDDVLLAFEKHATSKITCGEDLDAIQTLGFRGEALSSISAVAKVDVTTKVRSENHGVKVSIHGGEVLENTSCGCPDGTTFLVRELFYNTPVRYKFLKKDATEAGHVIDLIERIALAHPQIAFQLTNNGSQIIRTRGDGILKNVIYSIYGKEVTEGVREIRFADKGITITGYAGGIQSGSSSRGRQSLFINGRYVRSKIVYGAIDEAYKTLMMKGKHPFVILNIQMAPQHVDVNVHPTKMEVRFSDDGSIYRWVHGAISSALFRQYPAAELPSQEQKPERTIDSETQPAGISSPGSQNWESNPAERVMEKDFTAKFDYHTPFRTQTILEVREEKAAYQQAVQELPLEEEVVPFPEAGAVSQPDSGGQEATAAPSVEQVSLQQADPEEYELLKYAVFAGQVFDTYIILQYKNEMIFMDQHAAHERVRYEKIKKQYQEDSVAIQTLLTPVVVELTKSEYSIYQNDPAYFSELGFGTEAFGDDSILVREIPVFVEISAVKAVIVDLIRDILESRERMAGSRTTISNEVISLMACKSAVKANQRLSAAEVRSLLDDLLLLVNPFTCPHGRPTILRMTKGDLEKKFKRI